MQRQKSKVDSTAQQGLISHLGGLINPPLTNSLSINKKHGMVPCFSFLRVLSFVMLMTMEGGADICEIKPQTSPYPQLTHCVWSLEPHALRACKAQPLSPSLEKQQFNQKTLSWPQDRVGETVGHSTVGRPDCTQQSGSRETQPSRENRYSLFPDSANVSDVFQTATQSRGKFPGSRGK